MLTINHLPKKKEYIMKKKLLSTLFTGTLILGFLFPAVQVKNPSGMVSTYGIIDCVYDNY